MSGPTAALAARLRAEGGLIAADVRADPLPADVEAPAGYEVVVAAVREGELLHQDAGRVVAPGDPDLALLAGDRLYALGLSQLADAGDVAGVAVLADVITACARAHARDGAVDTRAIWAEGAARLAAAGKAAPR
ncbi:MAG: hypothetical protein ACLGI3_18535 [Actinomycetes bacterium]